MCLHKIIPKLVTEKKKSTISIESIMMWHCHKNIEYDDKVNELLKITAEERVHCHDEQSQTNLSGKKKGLRMCSVFAV